MNRKVIRVTLTLLGEEKKFTSSTNQLTATGLKISTNITYGNGAIMPVANIRIYGLKMESMSPLIRVRWNTMQALMNTVKIEAGEEGEQLSTVFEGNITFAYPDMAGAPDIALVIDSQSAILENLKPAGGKTIDGEYDIAQTIGEIAAEMGYAFENNGVTQILDVKYLADSNLQKIQALAHAADIDLYIEQGLIAIAPKGGARKLKVPKLKPQSGLVGYPIPDVRGVKLKCFYDPLIRFGGLVQIEGSTINPCDGMWRVFGVSISLEANIQNGNWFCEVNAAYAESKDAAITK